MEEKDTIAAIATAQGIAALAVIRISGNEAFTIFEKSIKEKEKCKNTKPRYAKNFTFCDEKSNPIDEIVGIKYKAPKSYTGEDIVEIISHGGIYTTKKIMDTLFHNGAKLAERGEFTKRAFINGKMELMKAEAIKAIIESRTEKEHSIALGSYYDNNEIRGIEEKIKEITCILEAEIEFGETDEVQIDSSACEEIKEIIVQIENEIKRGNVFERDNNKIKIVITGPTNAGKSSLFNTILGYKRSIVCENEGTTRDKVNEKIIIDGIEVEINDTAGFRKTEEVIETSGIKITEEAIKDAHLVIWLTDVQKEIDTEEKEYYEKIIDKKTIVVLNKIDLNRNIDKEEYYRKCSKDVLKISIKEKINLEILFEIIRLEINRINKNISEPKLFINKRQKEHIKEIKECLEKTVLYWEQKEIAALYLKKAIKEIEKNNGINVEEKIIDSIFEKFCIGK